MPTIKDSLYFNYDGVSSSAYNIVHINTGGGMFEDVFVASRDIAESKPNGRNKPFFNRINLSPIEFKMEIAFDGQYDDIIINDVIMWLFQDKYKPLFFEDKPEKIYYCTPVGDSSIIHNGFKQGYVTITMRCDSPYIYSPIYTTDIIDLSNNDGVYTFQIDNKGHFNLFPEISIKKVGAGSVSFRNVLKDGEMFTINNLTDTEEIYINCEKEIIESNSIGIYRYSDITGEYLELPYGNNIIEIEGKCTIQFRYQFRFKF